MFTFKEIFIQNTHFSRYKLCKKINSLWIHFKLLLLYIYIIVTLELQEHSRMLWIIMFISTFNVKIAVSYPCENSDFPTLLRSLKFNLPHPLLCFRDFHSQFLTRLTCGHKGSNVVLSGGENSKCNWLIFFAWDARRCHVVNIVVRGMTDQ